MGITGSKSKIPEAVCFIIQNLFVLVFFIIGCVRTFALAARTGDVSTGGFDIGKETSNQSSFALCTKMIEPIVKVHYAVESEFGSFLTLTAVPSAKVSFTLKNAGYLINSTSDP